MSWGARAPPCASPPACPVFPHVTCWRCCPPLWGFFHSGESPHGGGYYHPGCAPTSYFHGGPLSAHSMLSDYEGRYLLFGEIPSFVYGGGPFPVCPGEFPRVPALVSLSLGFLGLLLRSSLVHKECRSSSELDATRSFSSPGHGPPL